MENKDKDKLVDELKILAKNLENLYKIEDVCLFVGFKDDVGTNTMYASGEDESLAIKLGYLELIRHNILNNNKHE